MSVLSGPVNHRSLPHVNSSLFSENNNGSRITFWRSASCRVKDNNSTSVRIIGCLPSRQRVRILRVKLYGKADFFGNPCRNLGVRFDAMYFNLAPMSKNLSGIFVLLGSSLIG